MHLPVASSDGHRHVIHLPSIRGLATHAGRHLLEATVVPLATFYLLLTFFDLHVALAAALAWSYSALIRRLVRRERIPGILVIGSMLLTVRAVIALATGSVFLYLLQPTLGTFLVAGLFLGSVTLRKPLAARLAHDFCPLPESLTGSDRMHRFFLRISLLWSVVYLINGAATLFLLMSQSVGAFLVIKTVASAALTVTAIGVSYLYFRRSMRHEGVVLRWARHGAEAPAAA